jgi:CheY-like chemotaxis protein
MACCASPKAVVKSVQSIKKNAKHLICDDSSQNRRILSRVLMRMLSIEVDEANGEHEAIEQVKQNGQYAIIWMDYMLGTNEKNGGEVCKRLRTEFDYKGIIIALTGYSDTLTRTICKDAGMNEFVAKPYKINVVRELSMKYNNDNTDAES